MSLEKYQDLNESGRLVPAFTDTHMHFLEYGEDLQQVNIRDAKSIKELIAILSEVDAEIVTAFGFNQENYLENRFPTRQDLDLAFSDRPVLVQRVCAHMTVVNTYVLNQLGLMDGNIPEIEGGSIDVDENGLPTGLIRENSRILLKNAGYYDKTKADIEKYILTAQADLFRKGISCVHSDDFSSFANLDYDDIADVFNDLENRGLLKIKVYQQASVSPDEKLKNLIAKQKGKLFEIDSLKIFTDGSLGGRTAELTKPYHDDESKTGISRINDADLFAKVLGAYKIGLPSVIHAIGDKAIDRCFAAFEKLNASSEYLKKCGIIHFQLTRLDQLDRLKKLGLRAYVQPIFLDSDAKVVYDRLGTDRAEQTYIWNTMHQKGINLYFGSDAPIDTPDVIKALYILTTRKTLDGSITFLENEKLDLETSLKNYRKEFTKSKDYIILDDSIENCVKNPQQNHICGLLLEKDNYKEIIK